MPGWSLEAQRRLLRGAGADVGIEMAERLRLTQSAEQSLAAGDADGALRAFERAADMVHAQDVELGIVRAQMQAGHYRQALSFASHAAGAHVRAPAGTALYVWLLHIGGQANAARRYLQEGLQRTPDDPALLAAQALLEAAHPWPTVELMAAPLRAAPYAHGDATGANAVFAGSGWLTTDDASTGLANTALVPATTLRGARRIWLRNGLGQTTWAEPLDGAGDAWTQRMRLATPLPLPVTGAAPTRAMSPAARPAFAGSPVYTVEFAAAPGDPAAPAWPLLRQGFFGHLPPGATPRRLTIDLAAGPRGGPVFDAQGHVVGLAVALSAAEVAVVPDPLLNALALPPPAATAVPARAAVGQVYEDGLRLTLQVIVVR